MPFNLKSAKIDSLLMTKSAKLKTISLKSLMPGMPGMEPSLAQTCGHAASVCLEEQRHVSGNTLFAVDGAHNETYSLIWDAVNDQMRRSWADLQDATERGAGEQAA
jgi:hypothetical protein